MCSIKLFYMTTEQGLKSSIKEVRTTNDGGTSNISFVLCMCST